jgi:hypothetical protein
LIFGRHKNEIANPCKIEKRKAIANNLRKWTLQKTPIKVLIRWLIVVFSKLTGYENFTI